MNIFKEIFYELSLSEIKDHIYLSSERLLTMIDKIQEHDSYEVSEFKAIYRLIFAFMMAATSLLPGDTITKEQNEAFLLVGKIFDKQNYQYPLSSKDGIVMLFESPQAVAMINNATINTVIPEHGVKELWNIFKMSVSDFRMFCYDYLSVAYGLSMLKSIESNNFNIDMFKQIKRNLKLEYSIEFEEDNIELYEFKTDIDIS